MQKKYLKHITTLIILSLIIIQSLIQLMPFSIELGSGDSSTRAYMVLDGFINGYSWALSDIWLPFYFIFYSIPLYFHYSTISLLVFHYILSLGVLTFAFIYLRKTLNSNITSSLCILALSTQPIFRILTSTALSNVSFSFFLLCGIIFHTKKENSLKDYITPICFILASFIRYEGLIFILVFLTYIIIQKQLKKFLISISVFLVPFFIHEYHQMNTYNTPFLHALLNNPNESVVVNKYMGFTSISSKLEWIIKLLFRNLHIIPLIGIFFKIKNITISKLKNTDLLEVIALVSFLLILLGNLNDSVVLFSRYWYTALILIFIAFIKYIPRKYFLLEGVLIVFIIFSKPMNLMKEHKSSLTNLREPIKLMSNFDKKVHIYIDDFYGNYHFNAAKAYNLEYKSRLHIYYYNHDILESDYYGDDVEFEQFIKQVQEYNIEYTLLIKGSSLYKRIIKSDDFQYKRYKEYNNFLIIKNQSL